MKRVKETQAGLILSEPASATTAHARSEQRANQLDGKTWTKYSISIWSDIKKSAEEIKLGHPAMFPLQLAQRLIECFTTESDSLIFDPFAGVGTTVVAADRMNKVGIGIEISSDFVATAETRLAQGDLFAAQHRASRIYCDDASNLLKYVSPNSVDLVITSPPYWDILIQKRTADYKAIRHYGDAQRDLGKITDYGEFLDALAEIFRLVFQVLKPNKYCAVVVMDLERKTSSFLSMPTSRAS
jgi:DNA modification methylase